MPIVWDACMSGVPAFGLPKIRTTVGLRLMPARAAAAAWSIRAITVMPRFFTADSTLSIASPGV
jgi:hypothetical protein